MVLVLDADDENTNDSYQPPLVVLRTGRRILAFPWVWVTSRGFPYVITRICIVLWVFPRGPSLSRRLVFRI